MSKKVMKSLLIVMLMLCLTVVPATAQLADTPWPKLQGDLKNTGVSPYIGPETSTLKWTFQTGYQVYCSPVVGTDDIIYVGSSDGKFYAINPDGTEKWNITLGDQYVRSAPAIDSEGIVYIGTWEPSGPNFFAIYPNGTIKWSHALGGSVTSARPTIAPDGTIIMGDYETLYAFYPNGTVKWTCTGLGRVYTCPGIDDDGTIYIGSYDYNLYAIYPNGTVKWSFLTGDQISKSSPSIDSNGIIYMGSHDDKLYAVYPDGTEKWNFTTGDDIKSTPSIGTDGTIYVGSKDGKLYAINPDGTEKWSFSTPETNRVYSGPTIDATGTIYIGAYGVSGSYGKVYAINPDGTEKWNYTTGNSIVYSSPAIGSDGTVYVGAKDNKLYAFGPGPTPPDKPDLTTTAITPPSSIIANISSTIGATINNTGTGDATTFAVTLSANGTVVDTQTVSGLASGGSTTVSFSWTPAAAGDYSLTVTADSADVIGESDETNNELSEVVTAVTTGYMGSTLTTYTHDVVRGDLLYTIGNSTYRGSMPSGETYTVEFNITDIPAGAAVKTARLYSYWCYSYEEPSASMDVTFDGTLQTPDASYIDRKGYGSYDRPYGTYAYNVDLAGNDGYTATITNTGDKFSIYAMGLLVVYEDDGNEVEYWINEGADIINSNYGITPEQATTDAPFDGTVTLADVESARLITVVPSGDKGNNTLLFNTYTESGIWNTPNIAVEERDITSYISSTGNLAQLRDDNADYMMPSGAFLVLQRLYVPPPTSSGVSLGATIRPAISIEVTPGTLNFGTLAPGQTSGEQTLGLSNTGGCNVSVTADVTDTADNLYVAGMLLDSGIWSSYSTEVAKSATDSVGAVLDVPDDYAGVGTQEGALIFWAETA